MVSRNSTGEHIKIDFLHFYSTQNDEKLKSYLIRIKKLCFQLSNNYVYQPDKEVANKNYFTIGIDLEICFS